MNVSDTNLSQYAWMVDNPFEESDYDFVSNGYAISVIMLLYLMLGLPLNAFIIVVIIKKHLYRQPIEILLLNLAIAYFLLCVLIMPLMIIPGFTGEYIFGRNDHTRCIICQLQGVLLMIFFMTSICTIAVMSVDRFIYLKCPLRYNVIATPKRMIVAVIILWLVCIVFTISPLFGLSMVRFTRVFATCYYQFSLAVHAVICLIPVLTLFVMYIWILCIARKTLARQSKRLDCDNADHEEAKKNLSKKRLRLVQVFGAIFTAHIVLLLFPALIASVVVGTGKNSFGGFMISYLLLHSGIVLHPILQVIFIEEMRTVFLKYFKKVNGVAMTCCKK